MEDSWDLLQVHEECCDLCGLCVQVCRQGALELTEERLRLSRPHVCDYCSSCEESCPQGALEFEFEIVWDNDK